MSEGKQIRLGRIFGESGKAMVLPVDHGLNLGRVAGLEEPWSLIKEAATVGCDGVLLSLGVAKGSASDFAMRGAPARLVAVDALQKGEEDERGSSSLVAAVAQASRLACDAVKVLMPWDVPAPERAATVARIGRVIEAADKFDVPVMVEPVAMYRPRDRVGVELEIDGARTAMELGADIVKMAYPGDRRLMTSVCQELRLPVVILGGPAGTTPGQLIEIVDDALSAGASGIVIGRNVWQRPDALRRRLLRSLVAVVHGEALASSVRKEFEELES